MDHTRCTRRAALAAITAFVVAGPAPAASEEWVQLAKRLVNFRTETDIVPVGLHRGLFTGLRIEAAGNAVLIESLRVHFSTGEVSDIPVRTVIKAGSRSRDILLPGLVRGIRHIEVRYRRVRLTDPASLTFYGRRIRK